MEKTIIIGGGPAGLTAAYQLCKAGLPCVVLEKDSVVGGLSRTVDYKGYLFDIGGHRFFTKVKRVNQMWEEVLSERDFTVRRRLSRIYYNNKFFHYPLRPVNALLGLGIWNSVLIFLSYIYSHFFPEKPARTFEQWVSNRFGKRLYNIFFKAYTEKVWGIPCSEISADWAAQRIQGLSLLTALKKALLAKQKDKKDRVIKTLIDQFQYPRLGPGMMWEKVTEFVDHNGGEVQLESEVEKIIWRADRVTALQIRKGDRKEIVESSHFISSMPVRELIQRFEPLVPRHVLDAANDLKYRDFLVVALILDRSEMFPDNWIYIHDPGVKMGRIQNFKNWSPDMVCDPGKTCLGLEYFCFEGDGLWAMQNEELIELGKRELQQLSLLNGAKVEDASVVRIQKAYPVYNATYLQSLEIVKNFLRPLANLQLVGRNGMHKYNNQDHSMLTAMLAVENILGATHNIWKVNTDGEYHEEVTQSTQEKEFKDIASTQPRVPERVLVRAQVK